MAHHSSDPNDRLAGLIPEMAAEQKRDIYEFFKKNASSQGGYTPPEVQRLREETEAAGEPLGATGEFPQGQLSEHDEGEIRLAVAHNSEGKIVLDFGKPVAWVGFDAEQAEGLADLLKGHARAVREGR